jgi:hypothetical protein
VLTARPQLEEAIRTTATASAGATRAQSELAAGTNAQVIGTNGLPMTVLWASRRRGDRLDDV